MFIVHFYGMPTLEFLPKNGGTRVNSEISAPCALSLLCSRRSPFLTPISGHQSVVALMVLSYNQSKMIKYGFKDLSGKKLIS